MKKSKICALALVVLVFATLLCGCSDNSVGGRMKAIEQSVGQAKVYTSGYTISDGSTVVYSRKEVCTKDGDGYKAEITEGRFNSSFEFEQNTYSRSYDAIDFSVNFDEFDFVQFDVKDGTVNALLVKDNVAKVLGLSQQAPSGNAQMTIKFDRDKVTELTVKFMLDSGRDVNYVYTFEY